MCYLNEYSCTVRCLNTDLNVSAAMNGTIQSLRPAGDQCRIMACEFVGEIGNGPMTTVSDQIPVFPLKIAAIGIIALVVISYWYYVSRKKEEDPLAGYQKKGGDP